MAEKRLDLQANITITTDVSDTREAETQIKKLGRQILELDEAFKKNVASQDNVREGLKKLAAANRAGSDEWDTLQGDLDRLSGTMIEQKEAMYGYATAVEGTTEATQAQILYTQKLAREMEEATTETIEANDVAREQKETLEVLNDAERQHLVSMQKLNYETEQNVLEGRAHARVLQEQANAAQRLKVEGSFLGVSMGDLRKSLVQALSIGGVAGVVFKGINLIEDGLRNAVRAAIDFQKASIETFTGLEEEIARTVAQVDGLEGSMDDLYSGAIRASEEIKRGPQETQETLRRLYNLGLDQQQAFSAMEASSKAARVANSDMLDVAITATNAFNAYGGKVYTVNQVLDYFAYITQNSNLEFEDLVTNMTRIISPAAEAGVGIEEVAGAMIVMNRQGDDMNEIGELLGNTLTQLNIPTTQLSSTFTEASGVTFPAFIQSGGDLVSALTILQTYVDATGQSMQEAVIGESKFFRDMQAGRGTVELTGRHLSELVEAVENSAGAVGALDEQYANFEGTMYLLNEELDATRERVYAIEGSLTKNAAEGWVQFKIQGLETIGALSSALDVFFDLASNVFDSDNFGVFQVRNIVSDLIDPESLTYEQDYNDLQREAGRIIALNKDITEDQLRVVLQVKLAEQERVRLLEIYRIGQDALYKEQVVHRQARNNANDLDLEFFSKAAEDAARRKTIEENALRSAEQRAYWEGIITERIQAQQTALDNAYQSSQTYIGAISALQEQIAETDDAESLANLNAQLEEATGNMETFLKQTIVDSIIATDGYTESTVDLAVSLGLLTEEAGELQKELVKNIIAAEQLGQVEGWDNLSAEAQAVAAKQVAEGVKDAVDAVEQFDADKWAEDLTPGWARVEGAFIDPIVVDPLPAEGDEGRLSVLEGELINLTEEDWKVTVVSDTEDAYQAITDYWNHIDEATKDRHQYIYVHTIYTEEDPNRPKRYATGGTFTVPQGYNNDDFMVGLMSGEQVTVTPAGDSPVPGAQAGGGGGMNIRQTNHFAPGVHNPADVALATKDGLYAALEKAGLV